MSTINSVDGSKETIEKQEKIINFTNKINDAVKAKINKKPKPTINYKGADISFIFCVLALMTLVCMFIEFLGYFKEGIILDVDISKFAHTLNAAIIMIGVGEGFRSFAKTGTSDTGTCPVPAYKIKSLIRYLIIFIVLTIVALLMEYYIKTYPNASVEGKPDFASNAMTDGLLSNVLSYLCARFGSKIAENIDLTKLPFFCKA